MDQVAANWAAQMAANNTMAHNPDYPSQIPGGWTAAAENVAQGHPTGAAMHDGWMNSSGHRANILGDYTDVGIAFLSSGGTTWGVEVFAKYPGHVGPANPAPPPPPAVAPAPAPAPTEAAVGEPTPPATSTQLPSPTPSATTVHADTGDTEIITATRNNETPAIAPGGWIGLIAGVAAVAAAAFVVIRRRRYFVER